MCKSCSQVPITHAWNRTKTDRKSAVKKPSLKKWILMAGGLYSQLTTYAVISRKKYINGVKFIHTANRISNFILNDTFKETEVIVFSDLKTH